jgi:expansin (peptidoglycan-binding protein)
MTGAAGMDGSGGMSGTGGMDAVDSGPMMCRAEATHMGGLTQYDQTALGNCGMPWPGNDLYGAMATDDYQSSAVCGMCVEVTGPTGMKAVISAVDQCPIATNPKCVAGHIDLSHSAYAAVVPANMPGEVPNSQPVSWRYVPCDASGPIVYHFKDGTHKDWLAVQIRNSRYGIAKIRWRKAGTGNFRDMAARTNDLAYFVADGPGTTTYDFEVTDVNGQVLVDHGVQLVTNGDAQGHAQFPDCTQ